MSIDQQQNSLVFMPGKRKYLLCADHMGISLLTPLIEEMVTSNLAFELIFIGKEQINVQSSIDLEKWLKEQKMGCYFYFAGQFELLKKIKKMAEEIGFSAEEAQYIGCGASNVNVFCCRCHGINKLELQASEEIEGEITCCHCELLLEVSDHYSSLRDAYLGYVAKL